jgi:CheY-like chemotaxis protein
MAGANFAVKATIRTQVSFPAPGTKGPFAHLPSFDKALEVRPSAAHIRLMPDMGLEHARVSMQFKVLVVDDSKLARMVMASSFRRVRPDWTLVEATSAQDALSAVAAGTVDVALVDFNMPGTDGLELVATIRKTHPEMPVAVVSANVQDEVIQRARELNAGFIPKPLTDEALGAYLSGAALRLKKAAL